MKTEYIVPDFHFSYPFLSLIKPVADPLLYGVFFLLFLATISITLGIYYKIGIRSFFVLYLYTFLLDATYYKNHYYLIALISFLLMFIPADSCYALKPAKKSKLYNWQLYILRFQFLIPFFMGGINKLNTDWLTGEPMRFVFNHTLGSSPLAQLLKNEGMVYFFSYAGMIFDLFIPFFILYKPTRTKAAILFVLFNATNHLILPAIGVFPLIMIASLIIFFEPDWPGKFIHFSKDNQKFSAKKISENKQKQIISALAFYCLLQLVVPLRHFLYPGNILWNSMGERFSWRMILKIERGEVFFDIKDKTHAHTFTIDPLTQHIIPRQYAYMSTKPEMILQYAHHIGQLAKEHGIDEPIVTARSWVSINGRVPQRQIKENIDLMKISHNTPIEEWVNSFENTEKSKGYTIDRQAILNNTFESTLQN